MGLERIVKGPEIWDDSKGFHFTAQLRTNESRDTVLAEVSRKLEEFYTGFGAALEVQKINESEIKYHVKYADGKYAATVILHKKSPWVKKQRDLPNRDYPDGQANRNFQNYWISVPRMADESKRQEHLKTLAEYFKKGPIVVATYREHKRSAQTAFNF